MKLTLSGIFVSALLSVTLTSCNNYNPTTGTVLPTSATHRAFVSNPVFPTATGGGAPALEVVDSSLDLLTSSTVSLISSLGSAGMMVVSPNKDRTLVFSPSDNRLGIVNNSSQSVSSVITLTGPTESFFFWTDNTTVFIAVPAAPVSGQPAGEVLRIDASSGSTTATLPIPGAHYIVPSPNGNQILVFSDNSDSATMISPALIGTGSSNAISVCTSVQVAVCTVPATFDRPVGAVFNSSGTTAYILNCGPQCGGVGAGPCLTFSSCTSISALDMTQTTPAVVSAVGVPAATIGLLQGNNLYVAGTPATAPDNDCSGITTAATTCGRLTQINIGSLSASSVTITNGYHNRIGMSFNGQLFIGSYNCANINTNSEVRGCLTIADTTSGSLSSSAVIAAPENGDVTGIEPIPNRNVVYVCEGGKLEIYSTMTDQLETNPAQPVTIGQAVDVKTVDFQ